MRNDIPEQRFEHSKGVIPQPRHAQHAGTVDGGSHVLVVG